MWTGKIAKCNYLGGCFSSLFMIFLAAIKRTPLSLRVDAPYHTTEKISIFNCIRGDRFNDFALVRERRYFVAKKTEQVNINYYAFFAEMYKINPK